jgi:hypothetical protein
MAKETYVCVKRDLCLCQKRPMSTYLRRGKDMAQLLREKQLLPLLLLLLLLLLMELQKLRSERRRFRV